MEILPTITTTVDWQPKMEEVRALGLERISLFLTRAPLSQRRQIYSALQKTAVQYVPFVHLRNDMDTKELVYLQKTFGTTVFNIHGTCASYPPLYDLSSFRDRIFVENHMKDFSEDLEGWAGICLDVAHLEWVRQQNPDLYQILYQRCTEYPIGCWHISGFRKGRDAHCAFSLKDFSYVSRYRSFQAPVAAMELENSIAEQMEFIQAVKGYLS